MSKPKTQDEAFQQDWEKTVSWAQSNGFSQNSYLPVYQMDAQRLQNGYTPMSAAERNIGIIAANNPNNVPSAPSDNPHPSNVFGNARSDLAKIVTGLEPQHLLAGLFDTTKNTIEDVFNPKRLVGPNVGTTAANWLQNTLLEFVPGAYDIGTVLRADPNLSGSEGFKALADHPLLSLLDLLPTDGLGRLAVGVGAGDKIANAAGMTSEQLAKTSLTRATLGMIGHRAMSMGIGPESAAGGIRQLTLGDTIQNWLQNSKLNVSGPVQGFVKSWFTRNQLSTTIFQNMLAPAMDAVNDLSTDEQQVMGEIDYRQQRGENLDDLLRDPKVTEKVKNAIKTWYSGPVRWEMDKAIAAGDVVPIRRMDGSLGLYSSKHAERVTKARDALQTARQSFLERLEPTDRLIVSVKRLDDSQEQLASGLSQSLTAARNFMHQDQQAKDDLMENIRDEYVPVKKTKKGEDQPAKVLTFGKKREAAESVLGEGGLGDQVVTAMRSGHDEDVEALLPVLARRLSRWHYESVNAADYAEFQGVKDMVDKLNQLVEGRKKSVDEIDKRIQGEAKEVHFETADDVARRQREVRELHQKHVAERKDLAQRKGAGVRMVRTALQAKLENLRLLRRQMEDAKLAQGDQAAMRATKAQADAIYAEVKQDINRTWKSLNDSIKQEKARAREQELSVQLAFEKEKAKLKDQQEADLKEQRFDHENMKMFHGSLMEDMRFYTDAVKEFQDAVYENPTDDLRNVRVEVYMNKLMDHLNNSEELQQGMAKELKKSGIDKDAFSRKLREDPDVIRELLSLFVDDVYEHPKNFSVGLTDAVKEAKDEATKSGIDEANLLIAEGHVPQWIPSVGTFDREPTSIKAVIGKGTPSVDVAFARANKLTATRHDMVLGVTRNMAKALERDTTISMVVHDIMPKSVTGRELREQLTGLMLDSEDKFNKMLGTVPHTFEAQMTALGLVKFDPDSLFSFTPPHWSNDDVYLPEGLVRALQKTMEMQKNGDKGLFDKTNQVFRYSILGLSPRYTAHILFGGTFLLALRSTPYMPFIVLKAAKAMKEGRIDDTVFRQPAQEGFGRFNFTLQQHAFASGMQLSQLAVQEHIEKAQGILLSKASPFHYLKGAADLNFRFTRYATRMQSAIAYFDYMSRAERQKTFIDDVTGKEMPMTKERAQQEGMQHVLDVFGDLRSMAPLERQIAKNILPFYGWTRHILKYVLTMPIDHPWRAMVLALVAFENSQEVPKGLPERIQFLFFLGSPDKQGNVSAIDTRFMDPLRDVANYASLGGWIQGLNPVFLGPAAMMDPQLVYGSTSLYPNLTYNDMYGIETAGAQGNALTGLQQFIPQLGAMSTALQSAFDARTQAASDPNAFYKNIFNSLNVPFAQVQKINVKQMAAKDAQARYEVAKQAASNAFSNPNSGSSGIETALQGYKTVPNPLNPDYEITPQQLQAVYNSALAQYPGQQPINVLLPPPTPSGY